MNLSTKKKIAIVGHGFVGKATDAGFINSVEKFIVDPYLGTTVDDLQKFKPEIIFICVPTPMGDDGSQDYSIVQNVVSELKEKCTDAIKVIKSTVLPSILRKLHDIDSKVIYNPEFLREKHADDDFINSDMIIFGGDRSISEKVSKAYLDCSKCKTKNHIFTDLETASIIKYSINTFLATKVIFFNEMFEIFNKLGLNDSWEDVIKIISMDKRIGSSHMDVPGHDGRKGFGGACFPKDSLALAKYSLDLDQKMNLLTKAIKINNKIRSSYVELDERESIQNVSFDDKI